MAVARDLIVATALTYVGVPFLHQGRSRSGVDCVGLVICTAHDLGITDYDKADYERDPDSDELVRLLDAHMDRKRLIDAEPGDLVLMALGKGKPKHVALLIDYDRMLHTYANAGKVVVNGFGNHWQHRVRGCYSFRGIA
jgi:cell wall-associated NlpC family hydrolase